MPSNITPKHSEGKKTPRPVKKPRGRTRERLLEAGCKLFARLGFDGTAISDLEREAGLKPGNGSFYGHFRSKEELLEEVIGQQIAQLDEIAGQRGQLLEQSLGDGRTDLLVHFRLRLMALAQVRDFIDILVREESRFTPEQMAALRARFVDGLNTREADVLMKLIATGDIVDADPRALAAVATCALLGNFLIKRYHRAESIGGVDDEKFCNVLADLLVGKVAKKAAGRGK